MIELPIIFRYKENQNRPKAVDDYQRAIFVTRKFFIEMKENQTIANQEGTVYKYDDAEVDLIEVLLKENEAWMTEKVKAQVEADKLSYNDPVMLTSDLESRGKNLQATVSAKNIK